MEENNVGTDQDASYVIYTTLFSYQIPDIDRFAERVLDKNQNCIMTRERTEMPFEFQSRSINHRSFGICMRRSERASTISRVPRCSYLPSQRGTCLSFLHQIDPCTSCKRYSIFFSNCPLL